MEMKEEVGTVASRSSTDGVQIRKFYSSKQHGFFSELLLAEAVGVGLGGVASLAATATGVTCGGDAAAGST